MCRHQFHDFKKVIKPKWGITEYGKIRHNLLIAHWLLRLLINWRGKKDSTIDIKTSYVRMQKYITHKESLTEISKVSILIPILKSDIFCASSIPFLDRFIIYIGKHENKIYYGKNNTHIFHHIFYDSTISSFVYKHGHVR